MGIALLKLTESALQDDNSAIESTVANQSAHTVWRVTLDLRGPSWIFDSATEMTGTHSYTGSNYPGATYGVWMPQVVSVHERELTLER